MGDGSGGFTKTYDFTKPAGDDSQGHDVQVADVNNDGNLDVIFANFHGCDRGS